MRSRAAIVIDQFGAPARHREIAAALGDLPIIEDAACAIGSTLDGTPCGAFGAISCLSFHPRKVITTGEGGACLTDDPRLADELRTLRNHGQRAPGVFAYPGPNQRLTEMQGAMGQVQLTRLDAIIAERRALADRYRAQLPRELVVQSLPAGATRNEQTFGAVLPAPFEGAARDAVLDALRRTGIEAGKLSYALHRLPSLEGARRAGVLADPDSVSHADTIVARGIALPLHGAMHERDVDRVVDALSRALE